MAAAPAATFQLHPDHSFHYEALRALGTAPYRGADIGECLSILPKIIPGDFESWYKEWNSLAQRVLSTAKPTYSAVTLRDINFRASHYFFIADLFLHGNQNDPRILENFRLVRKYFDMANSLLSIPGKRINVPTKEGTWEVPIMVFRASSSSSEEEKRPTLIIGGGFGSNMEETYHDFGIAALERGYNVILYEGPGQPSFVHGREPGKRMGFRYDWEAVVTPIVDHIFAERDASLSFIDTTKLGLLGMSLGGYLCERAAAFEPRLAAVIAIDGVWSFLDTGLKAFAAGKDAWEKHDEKTFNELFEIAGRGGSSTNQRWIHDHIKFSFNKETGWEIFEDLRNWEASSCLDNIKMPTFVGLAMHDIFFLGQPEKVAEALGDRATLVKFDVDQAAHEHCQSGALIYLNQEMLEWFAGVVGK